MSYTPPPQAAQRPRRTLRTVLIVVGIVLAVCCVGGIAGGFWLYRTVQDSAGPAEDATKVYIDDVIAGDYHGAYAQLCDRIHEKTTEAEYTRIQSAQLKFTSYEIVGVSVANFNGKVTATVNVRLIQETGAEIRQSFPLVQEDGVWRICG